MTHAAHGVSHLFGKEGLPVVGPLVQSKNLPSLLHRRKAPCNQIYKQTFWCRVWLIRRWFSWSSLPMIREFPFHRWFFVARRWRGAFMEKVRLCSAKFQRRRIDLVDIFIDPGSSWSKTLEEGVNQLRGPVRWLEPSATGSRNIPQITWWYMPHQSFTHLSFGFHWLWLQKQPCFAACSVAWIKSWRCPRADRGSQQHLAAAHMVDHQFLALHCNSKDMVWQSCLGGGTYWPKINQSRTFNIYSLLEQHTFKCLSLTCISLKKPLACALQPITSITEFLLWCFDLRKWKKGGSNWTTYVPLVTRKKGENETSEHTWYWHMALKRPGWSFWARKSDTISPMSFLGQAPWHHLL